MIMNRKNVPKIWPIIYLGVFFLWLCMAGVWTLLQSQLFIVCLTESRGASFHFPHVFVFFPPGSVKYNNLHVDADADVKTDVVYRLKELVPSVCVKDNVSQLDVILEAIRYIASLQVSLFLLSDIIFFWYVDKFLFCLQIYLSLLFGDIFAFVCH